MGSRYCVWCEVGALGVIPRGSVTRESGIHTTPDQLTNLPKYTSSRLSQRQAGEGTPAETILTLSGGGKSPALAPTA